MRAEAIYAGSLAIHEFRVLQGATPKARTGLGPSSPPVLVFAGEISIDGPVGRPRYCGRFSDAKMRTRQCPSKGFP